jgi:hypothetical protein
MQHERGTRVAATNVRAQEDNQTGNYYTGPRNRAVTAEQRFVMIQEAAYYCAGRRGFWGGDPTQDWLEAEREVDAILAIQGRESVPATN